MKSHNYKFINLDYLSEVAGDDLATRATLLDLVAKELLETIPQLSQLYTDEAWTDIKSHTHRMKTTMAFAGSPELKSANESIWKAMVSMESPHTIAPLIRIMEAVYIDVVGELKQELDSMMQG